MHSKNDRLVIFLIVGGCLLMLIGAVSFLLSDLQQKNLPGAVTNQTDNVTASEPAVVATDNPGESTVPSEKKILDQIINALNDENKEEEAYKNILGLQVEKFELEDFKLYMNVLRLACNGNVVGYKPVSATEAKAINLEMSYNNSSNLPFIDKYKYFNLVSEHMNGNKKITKMNLLVFSYSTGKIQLTQRLLTDMVEPYYMARLYANGLQSGETNLIANVLYTDLPQEENLRVLQAEKYLFYYRNNVRAGFDNCRIEEIRPDYWLVSFPLLDAQAQKKEFKQTSSKTAATNSKNVAVSDTSIRESANSKGNSNRAFYDQVAPFNELHYSSKFYVRLQKDKMRHYVRFVRQNNTIVAFDNLPEQELAGAWNITRLGNKQYINVAAPYNLAQVKNMIATPGEQNLYQYSEAIYGSLIRPQIKDTDKAEKIYSRVMNYKTSDFEAFSFVRGSLADNKLMVDFLAGRNEQLVTDSNIGIGMTREDLLKMYPDLAMSKYRLIKGPTILEIQFDNQSKSGILQRSPAASDKVTGILFYSLEWYQQNFDMANLRKVAGEIK